MNSKLYCSPLPARRASSRYFSLHSLWMVFVCMLASTLPASAGDAAPPWMHTLVSVPLPAHDDQTDAVLLYSETNVVILSTDKVKTQVRHAYKILRPNGRDYGTAYVPYTSPGQKVTSLHGWCIPAQGKDYEVKDKEALDMALDVEGGELISDSRLKVLHIPAPDPGNIVGYEYEIEEKPLLLQDGWYFQRRTPVRESRYSLQLPPGWEYKASWRNYASVAPTQNGTFSQWVLNDVPGLKAEDDMPPMDGVTGHMIVSYYPPGGPVITNGYNDWKGMGNWYHNLEAGRLDTSPEIKQKAVALTSSASSLLQKMNALASFVQSDIRYVAIELGIGGWQPHPVTSIFTNRYGDCKDKGALTRALLKEIGIDSYHVAINTSRGSITPDTPAYQGFNHAIVAVKLPDNLQDPSLIAILQHPRLGRLLFFDPTDELTPYGQISGNLQANWALLVTPDGGELIELPKQPAAMNSIQRTAKLILDENGTLKGDVQEVRLGDRAWTQRWSLRNVTKDSERIKPIERLLADSLSTFQITRAGVVNLNQKDQPFGFDYSFLAQSYAKNAGGLLLLRPRVLGTKARGLLETKEPRKFPIEFDGPQRDTDTFEITLPPGYEVEDLPPPVNADFSFASYQSKAEVKGNVIRYQRMFEVKELSVPVSKAEELKKFYRIIASDERNTAVLRPATK